MKLPEIETVTSADEASELAIDWQAWQTDKSLTTAELVHYIDYFQALADKYDLTDEFKENGII